MRRRPGQDLSMPQTGSPERKNGAGRPEIRLPVSASQNQSGQNQSGQKQEVSE